MSLSGALSNALSGLTVAGRAAAVVSSNISNALNDGYGRRELEVSTRQTGSYGGVMINGVVRHVDSRLVGDWRAAGSDMAYADTNAKFFDRMETITGTPEDSNSLSGRMATFENALIAAAARPDLPERLSGVLNTAKDLAETFNAANDGIQKMREEADAEIGATVERANALLQQVQSLNISISKERNTGGQTASLMDHRQAVIDELSEIVPVIEAPRGNDTLALYTPGGAILIDGTAATLGFSRTNTITAHMTRDNGLLSGLTINGVEINTDSATGPVSGGRLGALFQIRDTLSVEAQANLDTTARDMVERYQDAGLDSTRAPGDPGLFTDSGFAFATADEVGLSGRIEVNAIVDPSRGGATWHLRAGLGAATSGSAGESTLLNDMLEAMNTRRVPTSAVFGTTGISAAGLASSLESVVGSRRNQADQQLSFASTKSSELKERLLADGVDTDQEMQRILLIEQTYAANARIVQTVESMIDTLMRI
ncbi:flagellar hook-associated protein FlgK [Pseudooceanicola sediminis]|uniref:Flagellar hook-associated protein 1 n=1 Tax=Pseudooceanicola sediminis TaxID=2211117 RepID=A0A399J4H0_9RHOB|nr:flagellar hook-associated protein FlgK [Pseudooceanicola sediminis]KAA2315531.1 flagellar hook-associated protein FlgK [Puniceibacterium sp. HSS470]RII40265.1 flagellar hook-associated protein FlgK [Pseudooceanicola sediminis]|tara:strand:- start:62949 stop:64403 length:1455 start_codon:yes stop_codon:yes gene_type:complete